MQKLLLTLTFGLLSFLTLGQNKGLNYQAVIISPKAVEVPGYAAEGQPLSNGKVWLKFIVKQANGIEYEETQQTTTDEFGLVNVTIGKGTVNKATSKYTNFDSIVWDEQIKTLSVGVNFDGQSNYTFVTQNQTLNFTPYALYAASVDYKNVRSAPTSLSQFTNDPGFLVNKDLEPIKTEIQANQAATTSKLASVDQSIAKTNTRISNDSLNVANKISIINTRIQKDSSAIVSLNNGLNDVNYSVSVQSDRINQTNNQINYVQNLTTAANQAINNLGATYENIGNKSNNIVADNGSSTKYPSVGAVQTYVANAISGIPNSGNLSLKENVSNKSTDMVADAASLTKYPAVKTVKDYVDAAVGSSNTISTATQAALNLKENTANKSTDIIADAASTTKYPSVKTIKDYVDVQVSAGTADATASSKGKIQLGGDLAGTGSSAAAPIISDNAIIASKISNGAITDAKIAPGISASKVGLGNVDNTSDANKPISTATQTALNLKENVANKSTDMVADAASLTKYPAVKTIKDYVDAQVSSGTADATTSAKGKIQLGGDLAGTGTTAAAPVISDNAITTAKINAGAVTDAKIATGISASKVGLGNVDNTSDANKPISTATQTALNLKENAANKSTDIVADAASLTKYPAVKTIKDYVDATVSSGAPDADATTKGKIQLAGDLTGTAASPAVAANAITTAKINAAAVTTAKIADANVTYAKIQNVSATDKVLGRVSAGAGVIEEISTTGSGNVVRATSPSLVTPNLGTPASAVLTNATGLPLTTGVTGTLAISNGGTGATSAGAALTALGAQATANLSTDLTADAASLTKYPAVKTIKDYVDGSVSSGAPDADANTKGKVQLAGDLTGTAASPVVAANAITTAKIANSAVTYAKIQNVSATDKVLGRVSTGAGVVEEIATTGSGSVVRSISPVLVTPDLGTPSAIDLTNATNLPLGSGTGTLPITKGGTGATTAAAALTALGAQSTANLSTDMSADATSTSKYPAVKTIKDYVDGSVSSGAPDADATTKGKVQLAGDLTGTAASPAVAASAITTAKINAAAVTTAKIADANVTYAKIQNVSATDKVLGRVSAGAGVVEEISTTGSGNVVRATSPTLVTPTLGVASVTSINGLTPTAQTTGFTISGGATSKTLTVNGDATISGSSTGTNTGDQTITLTGDVTGTGTGSFATTIANDAVTSAKIKDGEIVVGDLADNAVETAKVKDANITLAKIQNIASGKVLGRATANAGVVEELATTGTGNVVRATSPTLVTPTLGVASATSIALAGSSSGTATLAAPSVAGTTTITLPAATGTLATLDGTETLTNKTFTAPALGTPASGVLTNATGLPLTSGVTGILPIANGGTGASTAAGALTALGAQSVANLSTDMSADATSTSKYPSVKTIKDYVDGSVSSGAPDADATTKGKVQLAGDLTGTAASPAVATNAITTAKINNAAVTTAKIADANVTYAKIQNVSATDKVLGRVSAGAGVVEEISTTGSGNVVRATSPTLVTPTLGVASATSINGLTPTAQTTGFTISGGTTSKTLTVNGDATISGSSTGTNTGDQTITLTGDVTGTGTGSFATTIANDAVTSAKIKDGEIVVGDLADNAVETAKVKDANITLAKIQNIASGKVLGRVSANAGVVEELATTGTGNVVRATSPTLVTPEIGAATGTSLTVTGQLTSSVATGTAPLVVTSTTPVANLSIGGNAATATTATNVAGGAAGSIPYQTAAGTTALLATGSANQFLTSNGTGGYTWTSASGVTGVPYTGATQAVNLGAYDLSVNGLKVGKGNSSVATNTAVGVEALNATTTGDNNVAIGYKTANFSTTGYSNTAIGAFSMNANSTSNSSNNTAVGYATLSQNITGGNNAVLGVESGKFISSGTNNSALGYRALMNIRGGSNNAALGNNTGPQGSTYSSSSSIFIGASAIPQETSNATNEIVIGANLTGKGSNTVIIGNSSITDNYFNGNINGATWNGTAISIAKGGTGATTAAAALTALGAQASANLSTDVTTDAASTTKYPAVKTIKDYVDAAATPDATSSAKGKVQLAGDLAGTGSTAAAPVISDNAITTSKINAAAVTTAKITDANVTYAKIQNVSATDKVLGRVSTGAGVIEEIATTGSGNVVRATSPTLVTPSLGVAAATSIGFSGSTSGTATLAAPAVAGTITITLPGATGTLATLDGTETLMNKTFTAPALGTPVSGVLTNATGLPLTTGVTGVLPISNGGTGASTAAGALTALGAQSVANLSTDVSTDAASTTKYPAVKTIKDYVDASISAGAPDADATTKGKVQLAGDLTGTAASPAIATSAVTTAKINDGAVTSAKIADGTIVNADINASAAIADTKLATIATSGKVSNSATTATDANTASTIVARDASGNFTAGTITADLTGLASKATNINGGAVGAIPYQSAANTTSLLGGNTSATKKFLTQTGDGTSSAAPVWGGIAVGDLTGTLPISAGGTGSTTQNFVDLTTAQTVAGAKTFSSTIVGSISGNAATVTNGVYTTNKLSALAATTSAELAGVISDETGSGAMVLATSPTLVTPTIGVASATSVTFAGSTSGTATISAPAVAGTSTAITLPATSGTLATLAGTETLTNKTFTAPALGTPASAVLTNATGLPLTTGVTGILPLANGGTGASTKAAAFDALSPLTTAGDLIYGAVTTGSGTRLGIGTTGQVLTVSGGLPAWTTFSGGVTTMAAVGTVPNANGASISGSTLTLQPADGTNPGVLTAGTQTIGGNKTFSSDIYIGNNRAGSGAGTGATYNSAFGSNALVANTSGAYNIAIGGATLSSNTTGGYNTAIGYSSLASSTSGYYNLAAGYYAANDSRTSNYNVALGYSALRYVRSDNNTAIGSYAGGNMGNGSVTGGANNVFVGYQAGNFYGSASGTNTKGNNSVYIGYDVRAAADNEANEIVISGYNGTAGTVGLGANTTLLGNNATQKSQIYGALTVVPNTAAASTDGNSSTIAAQDAGTGGNNNGGNIILTPGAKTGTGTAGIVQVNGQIKITGGSPAAGSVLTSDASGLASWTALSGGVTTMAAVGSVPNANGASISGTTLTLQPASSGFGGVVNTTTQTFAGAKSFTSDIKVNSLTVGMGNSSVTTNTAFGNSALYANTSGTSNTAIGWANLSGNTSGYNNTTLGANVLTEATTNNDNVAIGSNALRYGKSSYNVVIGSGAAGAGSTGSTFYTGGNNIFLGYNSGRYVSTASTDNLTGNNSVLIGYDVRPNANGETNEIVLAAYNGTAGAVGLGSNTTLIGNSSTQKSQIYGALTVVPNTAGNNIDGASSTIQAQNATTNGYKGGNINLTAGNGVTTGVGGNIVLTPGAGGGSGSGAAGQVTIDGLIVGKGFSGVTTNTAVGASALAANLIGSQNTAVGYQTLKSITSNSGNTGVGYSALSATYGSNNTGVGNMALLNNSTGSSNTAVGGTALKANTTGASNSAFGSNAGTSINSGDNNTFLGASAGTNITSGSNNVILGASAGTNNGSSGSVTSGTGNVLIGYDARPAADGDNNEIVIGGYSASNSTVGLGSNTTVIGNYGTTNAKIFGILNLPYQTASTSKTTGALTVGGGAGIAGNTYIGGILNVSPTDAAANTDGAGTTIASQAAGSGGNNKGGDINITTGNGTGSGYGGDVIFNMGAGTSSPSTGAMFINTTANPLAPTNSKGMINMLIPNNMDGMNIKSASPGSNVINIWQTGTGNTNALAFYKGDSQGSSVGAINITTSATTYGTASDYRLKTDFKDFNGSKLLDSIKVYDYQWKVDGTRSFGVKAHELQQIIPYAVNGAKDAVNADGSIKAQSVDYSKIVPVLVKAMQEQESILQDAKKENQLLKDQIELQNKRLERLEKLLDK